MNLSDLLAIEEEHKAFAEAVISIFNGDLLGRQSDSYNVDALAFLAAGITSSQYVSRRMADAYRAPNALELLSFAYKNATLDGLVMEFGVWSGRTINHIADLKPEKTVYGFDSFKGLPERWRPGFELGAFSAPEIPRVSKNVELIVGLFDRMLPTFLDDYPNQVVQLLHIDCDLYSSTQTIFSQLKRRIVPGTIIVFDEYYNYPNWEMHEFRAFQEFTEMNHVHYDYIGLVPSHQQVAVRIVG